MTEGIWIYLDDNACVDGMFWISLDSKMSKVLKVVEVWHKKSSCRIEMEKGMSVAGLLAPPYGT